MYTGIYGANNICGKTSFFYSGIKVVRGKTEINRWWCLPSICFPATIDAAVAARLLVDSGWLGEYKLPAYWWWGKAAAVV